MMERFVLVLDALENESRDLAHKTSAVIIAQRSANPDAGAAIADEPWSTQRSTQLAMS